jgi:hypothetical protein
MPKNKGWGDIQATLAGGGFPKYTTTQRNALTVDATAIATNKIVAGTVIYNSTTNKINFWNGAAWEAVTSA